MGRIARRARRDAELGLTRLNATLFHNASVRTLDSESPRAEAILVIDGQIRAVGTTLAVRTAASTAAPRATEVDLHGATVVPGFNDAHVHLMYTGWQLGQLRLHGLSKREIIAALQERAAATPPGRAIMGYGWDYPTCPDPHRRDLDEAVPDRPVVLSQFSGHGAWANTKGMALLGGARRRTTWKLGGLDRDADGSPSGIVREPGNAPGYFRLIARAFLSRAEVERSFAAAMDLFASYGITSVGDNTWFPWHAGAIARLGATGRQSVRVNVWSRGRPKWMDAWMRRRRFDPHWRSLGARKFFLDGAFSSHTAWLHEPYADRPETRGAGLTPDEIEPFLEEATRAGIQVACHSIGDAATTAFLDAAERVAARHDLAPLRHRIEHAQIVAPGDIERIARLGIVVSAQPHAAATPEKDVRLLGEERARRAYPFRSLIDAGVPLAFGSDYPGEATFNPLYGMQLAVNRPSAEAISAEEALRAYTTGGAHAEFAESWKGRIAVGYAADLTVLSADPTTVAADRIADLVVEMTVVDGRIVYRRDTANANTNLTM